MATGKTLESVIIGDEAGDDRLFSSRFPPAPGLGVQRRGPHLTAFTRKLALPPSLAPEQKAAKAAALWEHLT